MADGLLQSSRRRDPKVRLDLPPIRDAGFRGCDGRGHEGTRAGDVTPAEAGEIGRLIETSMRAIECTDFERRLRAVEATPCPRRYGRSGPGLPRPLYFSYRKQIKTAGREPPLIRGATAGAHGGLDVRHSEPFCEVAPPIRANRPSHT